MQVEKNKIRSRIKAQKAFLAPQYKKQSAQAVKEAIEQLPQYQTARSILLYKSLPDELPTEPMLLEWYPQKKIYLPIVEGDEITIGEYIPGHLQSGAYGIDEPERHITGPVQIDMAIIPGVAFSADKARLGRGRGYYDKLLSRMDTYKIGIAYHMQLLPRLPAEPHDINMDCIITEKETII